MTTLTRLFSLFIALFTLASLLSCGNSTNNSISSKGTEKTSSPKANTKKSTSTIYFVRHADKIGEQDKLSEAGIKRANNLAEIMKDRDISAIYTTNYERTKNTARPLCKAINVEYEIYDVGHIMQGEGLLGSNDGFRSPMVTEVFQLIANNQNALIVGHSNTILKTIKEFKPLVSDFEIGHDEYDKIYSITMKNPLVGEVNIETYGESSM